MLAAPCVLDTTSEGKRKEMEPSDKLRGRPCDLQNLPTRLREEWQAESKRIIHFQDCTSQEALQAIHTAFTNTCNELEFSLSNTENLHQVATLPSFSLRAVQIVREVRDLAFQVDLHWLELIANQWVPLKQFSASTVARVREFSELLSNTLRTVPTVHSLLTLPKSPQRSLVGGMSSLFLDSCASFRTGKKRRLSSCSSQARSESSSAAAGDHASETSEPLSLEERFRSTGAIAFSLVHAADSNARGSSKPRSTSRSNLDVSFNRTPFGSIPKAQRRSSGLFSIHSSSIPWHPLSPAYSDPGN